MSLHSTQARVAELWVYPVKALGGVRLTSAVLEPRGLRHDRRFMLVDEAGRFVTQREHPRLARLAAEVDEDAGLLRVSEVAGSAGAAGVATAPLAGPGDPRREVTVWGDRVLAERAGGEIGRLVSELCGQEIELVRMPPDARRPVDPAHARSTDTVSFADGFPTLAITLASVRALTERAGRPLDPRRFRANIIVDGVPAFSEDRWARLSACDVTFHAVKPCGRCRVIDVDPASGERAAGVLAALAGFRSRGREAIFGQNLVHDGGGTLLEGAAVTAYSDPAPR